MEVTDGRGESDAFTLESHGFVFRRHPDGVLPDFHDADAITRDYYPAVAELIRSETGASHVIVFDHTYRSSRKLRPGESDANQPVVNVHSDYTEGSGPERARRAVDEDAVDEAGADKAAANAISEQRYRIINVWRPIRGPIEQKPLAVCDAGSMNADDFVPTNIHFPDGRLGHVMAIRHADSHRWHYFPQMTVDEVLLFNTFDPRADGARRYGAHCAVDEQHGPPDPAIRESVEIRALALFDGHQSGTAT